ncbi:MarR family winged helix-turn-helix transcriptional regulator [Chelatococcus reniformis]|nr:MarR family winged helix-turn-helix transcriptional regulator [Chelatococcus reniformis]
MVRRGAAGTGQRGGAAQGGRGAQPRPADVCNAAALRRATRRVSQIYDAMMAPSGIRSTQRSVLAQIARSGTPTIGDLAEAMVLDRSALAHNLKPLERDGYVVVRIDPADRRNRIVGLTDAGWAKLDETFALWSAAQHRFEATFGPDQAAALRAALQVIASPDFAARLGEAAGD